MEQYVGDIGLLMVSVLMLLYVSWDMLFPK